MDICGIWTKHDHVVMGVCVCMRTAVHFTRNDNNYYLIQVTACTRADVKNQTRVQHCCMEFAINVPVIVVVVAIFFFSHFNDRSCHSFAINSSSIRYHSVPGCRASHCARIQTILHVCVHVDLCFTCDLRSPTLMMPTHIVVVVVVIATVFAHY